LTKILENRVVKFLEQTVLVLTVMLTEMNKLKHNATVAVNTYEGSKMR